MSGVVYGLLGYVWMRRKCDFTFSYYLHPYVVWWMLGWLVVCWIGWVAQVANTAHIVGLAAGILIGYWPGIQRKLRI